MATQHFRDAGGWKGNSDRAIREGQGCCTTYAQLQGSACQSHQHAIKAGSVDIQQQRQCSQQQL